MGMKKGGVEGIVNLSLHGELHVVGYWTDDLCDSKWAEVFGSEFCGRVCHFQVGSFNPYLLSLLIGAECSFLVPECLHLGHGLVHVFLCLFYLSLPLFDCHTSFFLYCTVRYVD
jgi:hypothetical protein